uniref:Senescence-associated protein n=1 Tax=Salix viminalis TaxID=40686 RepID=A0A6N2K2Z3_SALVM
MNAWLPQASYPCGNFSDTSSFKFRRSKGSIGHAFTVRIRTGNQNQTSFYPFVPHEISVLVELILGHLRYLLTDVPPSQLPPDNVCGLGSKKRGSAPPPIHGISKITLKVVVFHLRRSSHLSYTSQVISQSRTGTPEPSPQSQSFSRGYGSILPTSLAYIVPSTRGCSPWRPDAVMSTTGRGRHAVLRIFKGRRGRTGHHATCSALPAAGPYLRLSRFQGPADVSGLPNVAVSRHVRFRNFNPIPFRSSRANALSDGLPRLLGSTNPCASAVHMEPFPSSAFKICTDGRSARARALGFAATAAPSYSSGPGACPDGRVSAQLGTVTRLPVHPASPVLLTKNGPLGALDSGTAQRSSRASFAPIPKSDERFARQYRCEPPPEFPLASPRSGIVHHLSGPDRHALTRTLLRRSRSVGGATLEGIPPVSFLAPYGFTRPLTRTHVTLLGPCFKTGRMGSPQADARSAHSTIAATASPQAFQRPGLRPPPRSASVHAPSRSADRLSPFHIRPGRIAGPHPLPSRQFQALFDSLFKVLFIFPSRYLFAIGLSPIFSLGRNLPPDWGCIPKQPDSQTAPRGAAGSSHDGALTLSGAPFQGTWAWSAAEDASPDYNSNAVGARFSAGISVRSPLLGESFILESQCSGVREVPGATSTRTTVSEGLSTTACRGDRRRGLDFRPTTGGSARETSIRPRPREPRGVGATMRDTQADVPSTRRPRAQLAFKDSMVHGILQFTPSIAFRYVLHRCESRDIRCRESFRLSQKEGAPRHRGYEGGLLVLNFLGASRAGVRWRAVSGADASLHGTRGHEGRVPPEPSLSCHGFAGRSAGAGFDNDPSAGSPTETLLRLLLPLNDKVQWTSRDVASGEPPTSPRSEHYTRPFNR